MPESGLPLAAKREHEDRVEIGHIAIERNVTAAITDRPRTAATANWRVLSSGALAMARRSAPMRRMGSVRSWDSVSTAPLPVGRDRYTI